MQRTIRVLSDFKELAELLEGANVDQVRIVSAQGRLRLEIELTRAMIERPATRSGLFKRSRAPWIKSKLVLKAIEDVIVHRIADGAQRAPLLSVESVSGGYTASVTSPDGLRLELTLEQLEGVFEDIGTPIEAP